MAVGAGVYEMGGRLGSRTLPSVLLWGVAVDYQQMVAEGPATDASRPVHALQGGGAFMAHGMWAVHQKEGLLAMGVGGGGNMFDIGLGPLHQTGPEGGPAAGGICLV